MPLIQRKNHIHHIQKLLQQFPVVAIIGPRQVGKTTLAKQIAEEHHSAPSHWFDLENPTDVARLTDPLLTLSDLTELVIIDEVQQDPSLFPPLRVLVDKRQQQPGQFLLLGSAALSLRQHSSETLAGRMAYYELSGFGLDEIHGTKIQQLWLRGGFPRSFLAASEEASSEWREQFIRSFLERDIPQLGMRIAPKTLRRFWMMLAHYHGGVWNASEMSRAFGVSPKTINHYLDILSSTFVVRQLQPWFANIAKRQVKSPKIYISDSGLLHALIGQTTMNQLEGHPKVGASWEGFALEQILHVLRIPSENAFFWATHSGAELDLLVTHKGVRRGFEFKRTLTPKKTHSMHIALETLSLDRIDVIYPGDVSFPLDEKIVATPLTHIVEDAAS